MKYKNLHWHGNPIDVQFGFMGVSTNKENPLWWYNYECSLNHGFAVVSAIRIKQNNQVWYICNDYNLGMRKLRNGGWPNFGHRSLPDDNYSFTKIRNREDIAKIMEADFNEESYAFNEAAREKWQKEKYGGTYEWEKSQALKKILAGR
jgi:hypothetical protein